MKKLLNWISNFLKDIYDLIEEKAPLAVRITQWVKTAIEEHNGSIEWLLSQTEFEGDDEAYKFFKEKFQIVAKEIAVVDGLVNGVVTTEVATKVYFDYIASKTKAGRVKDIIFLAAMILQAIITKKVPIQALILATQKAYQLIFAKK